MDSMDQSTGLPSGTQDPDAPVTASLDPKSHRSAWLDRYGIRAVLFDMDGVLIDTMAFHYEAYRRVLEPEGLSVEPIEISSREGLGTPAVLRSLSEARGWGLAEARIEELADRRRQIFYQIYEHRVYPEVPQLLDFLKDLGYMLAVVSGATQQSLDVCLNEYECAGGKSLAQWFSLILSGTSVPRGKPHPDPYLIALERLGIEGRQALVVENAPAGIQAAKQAGCYCAAVQTTLPETYLRQADWIVPNHAALLHLLRRN